MSYSGAGCYVDENVYSVWPPVAENNSLVSTYLQLKKSHIVAMIAFILYEAELDLEGQRIQPMAVPGTRYAK